MSKIQVKYIDTRKYIATVTQDDCACNDDPQSWGCFTIETFGRHHGQSINQDDIIDDTGELLPAIKRELKSGKRFWLDRYEHGGVTYSLTGEGMNCKWDTSRQCGFIVLVDEVITGLSKREREEFARGELNTFNQWLNGEIYYIEITTDTGLEVDSCGGYYGSDGIQAFIDEVCGDAQCEVVYA